VLKTFLKRAQNEFDANVKKIRSDNGTEFNNTQVKEYLNQGGIKHEFSPSILHNKMGVTERKNRILIESTRTMPDEYKTFDCFGPKLSTRHVIPSIGSIFSDS
jgi:hypothetical protein